mmetsp:Transcript_9711/g.21328  ORF Transcript_9711/g.21328 Transcript_9711/m.21328 type:complete len:200 (-) Transcript_9711:3221-3820(-)
MVIFVLALNIVDVTTATGMLGGLSEQRNVLASQARSFDTLQNFLRAPHLSGMLLGSLFFEQQTLNCLNGSLHVLLPLQHEVCGVWILKRKQGRAALEHVVMCFASLQGERQLAQRLKNIVASLVVDAPGSNNPSIDPLRCGGERLQGHCQDEGLDFGALGQSVDSTQRVYEFGNSQVHGLQGQCAVRFSAGEASHLHAF